MLKRYLKPFIQMLLLTAPLLAPHTGFAQMQNYRVKAGENLGQVAASFYGSEDYAKVIAKINDFSSTKELIDGKTIAVPDLKDLLFEEGLDRSVSPEIDLIVKARYTYMVNRNELLKAIAPGNSKGKIIVPPQLKADLLQAANDIETAAKDIAKKGNFFEAPVRMRRELLTVAKNIRKMAKGVYKKEYDDSVQKKIANAFYFGVAWARDEAGNYHKLAH